MNIKELRIDQKRIEGWLYQNFPSMDWMVIWLKNPTKERQIFIRYSVN